MTYDQDRIRRLEQAVEDLTDRLTRLEQLTPPPPEPKEHH